MERDPLRRAMVAAVLLLPFMADAASARIFAVCATQVALASRACSMALLPEEAAAAERSNRSITGPHGYGDGRREVGNRPAGGGSDLSTNSPEYARGNQSHETAPAPEHEPAPNHGFEERHGGGRRRHHGGAREGHGHGHGHGHEHRRGRKNRGKHHRRKKHHRRHHHGHHHLRRDRTKLGAQRHCCRLLKRVEARCVCRLLFRLHMPSFLVQGRHTYSVAVGDGVCTVSYRCGGMWFPVRPPAVAAP